MAKQIIAFHNFVKTPKNSVPTPLKTNSVSITHSNQLVLFGKKLLKYNETYRNTAQKIKFPDIIVVHAVTTKFQTVKENDILTMISSFCNLTGKSNGNT
jgi:hypothetical protein